MHFGWNFPTPEKYCSPKGQCRKPMAARKDHDLLPTERFAGPKVGEPNLYVAGRFRLRRIEKIMISPHRRARWHADLALAEVFERTGVPCRKAATTPVLTLFRSQAMSDLGRDGMESGPSPPVASEIFVRTSNAVNGIVRVEGRLGALENFSIEMGPLVILRPIPHLLRGQVLSGDNPRREPVGSSLPKQRAADQGCQAAAGFP